MVTRPDIVYSIRTLSQFVHGHRIPYWNTTIRILKYIKGTSSQGLLLPSTNNLTLKAFYYSNGGGCHTKVSYRILYFPWEFSLLMEIQETS